MTTPRKKKEQLKEQDCKLIGIGEGKILEKLNMSLYRKGRTQLMKRIIINGR